MKGNEYIIDRFWKSCFYIKKTKLNNEEDTVGEKGNTWNKATAIPLALDGGLR